jgi:hypothetical protein
MGCGKRRWRGAGGDVLLVVWLWLVLGKCTGGEIGCDSVSDTNELTTSNRRVAFTWVLL